MIAFHHELVRHSGINCALAADYMLYIQQPFPLNITPNRNLRVE